MRILVLTKRQYMGKDLIDDRFGRFRELPIGLSELGHDVHGVALSYRRRDETTIEDSTPAGNGRVTWRSINLCDGLLPRVPRFAAQVRGTACELKPDVIWAGSDAYHALFGFWLGKRIQTKCVIDLYDNFEAFGASKVPLVVPLFRRAVRKADGVSSFSNRLADHVIQSYRRQKPTCVVENGVRKELFEPLDRARCRQRLGLPENATLIGTAGALDPSRGIENLFRAFESVAADGQELFLALAGPLARGVRIPDHPRVRYLGALPHPQVPIFINALDLAVICYRRSAQGDYSFPQKAYEILACRIPLVAAAVGAMNDLLHGHPDCLYEPENPISLAAAIRRQLQKRTAPELSIPSWSDSAKSLAAFFEQIVLDP